jgi:hypothetical protein
MTRRHSWLLLSLTGWVLVGSGLFAIGLAAFGNLLPHDVRFLGMTSRQLCALNACRIVHFMSHDRVSFGGSIIAIGLLYHWLAAGPVRRGGEAWAWWTLVISGGAGFASFLTYLGYGYLDLWHGWATLALLVAFVAGLAGTWPTLARPRSPRTLLKPGVNAPLRSRFALGRFGLMATAGMLVAGGLTIMTIGMTHVFVPQDLEYMGLTVADLNAVNPRLVPLIAHDRAGFGGGLASGGLAILLTTWRAARPGDARLWRTLLLAGLVGFGCAILIHPAVGYTSFSHLAPAYAASALFVVSIALLYGPMCRPQRVDAPADRPIAPVTRPV